MKPANDNWYPVMCPPQKEPNADLELRRQGYETFFPHLPDAKVSAKSKRLPELAKRAFLPRYLFCRITDGSFGKVNDTPFVSTIVTLGGRPFPILPQAMNKIFGLARTDEERMGEVYRNPAPAKNVFLGKPGDVIRIGDSSPFWNFMAVIKDVVGERVFASLIGKQFLGKVDIELNAGDVAEIVPEDLPAA